MYSDTGLPQETIFQRNKQAKKPNLTPEGSRKRTHKASTRKEIIKIRGENE